MRFLNSFPPSPYSPVTYSKLASISAVASFASLAILQVHSSDCVRNSACSMFMYIMVLLMFLCPSTYFTCMMSLVLWYSIVPL